MKNTFRILVFFSFLFCGEVSSQTDPWENRHFIDAGYGLQRSSWYSNLHDFDLYNNQGVIVKSGDLKIRARNGTSLFHFDVSFPFSKIRLGMGISFVNVYMDKIVVQGSDGNTSNIFFDEKFIFDKLYAVVEVPLKIKTQKNLLLSLKSNVGYFSYSGVKSLGFFGEDSKANTTFANVGVSAGFGLYPHLFLFLYPNFEYMQLKSISGRSDITHRVISGGISGGIRMDLTQ